MLPLEKPAGPIGCIDQYAMVNTALPFCANYNAATDAGKGEKCSVSVGRICANQGKQLCTSDQIRTAFYQFDDPSDTSQINWGHAKTRSIGQNRHEHPNPGTLYNTVVPQKWHLYAASASTIRVWRSGYDNANFKWIGGEDDGADKYNPCCNADHISMCCTGIR